MFLRFCATRCREKKRKRVQELFPTHPTYQNPINMNPRPLLCKVSWIFGFWFFVARCLSKNDKFGRFPRFPDFSGVIYRKINWFCLSEMVPWLKKKSEDQPGGQRTNLKVFGDEVSFQYFPKTWKSTSPMPCKTKPCQSSRESLRMVHAMPPDTPRRPKYHLKAKNRFLWKSWFSSFFEVFDVFWPYRTKKPR